MKHTYAPAGNLLQVIDWAGRTTQYEYDANGRLVKTTRPDGSVEIREYDNNSCLTKLHDVDCDNEYDFEYDELSNITAESSNNSQSAVNTAQAAMTVTSDNRLATWNGETVTYDADGNMTCGPLNGNMTAYTFDCRNRLTAVGNTYYRYDAENNRIAVNQNGAITRYVINPNAALSQVLMKTDPDETVTYYVYGLGLIGQETNGVYQSYHFDLRGSTVALTDNNGDVTDSFQYGVYGEVERISGSTDTPPFLYNGRDGVITDANGLYYMWARYYSPEIMRFIRQDDLVGSITDPLSLNRYAYVKGNPVVGVDPTGLFALPSYNQWLYLTNLTKNGDEGQAQWAQAQLNEGRYYIDTNNNTSGYYLSYNEAEQMGIGITPAQLEAIGWKNVSQEMTWELNNTLVMNNITTTERIRQFISQITVESGYGQWITEYGPRAYFRKYDFNKAIGNSAVGEGYTYRGAGYIQLTGKANYYAFMIKMGDPRIMEGADYVGSRYAWEASGFWWTRNGINNLIDNGATVTTITSRVTGDAYAETSHLQDRMCMAK